MKRILHKEVRPFLFPALLLIFTLCGGLKIVSPALMPFRDANNQFIEQAVADTSHLLVPVGLAKAGADMIEGSTVEFEAGAVVAKSGFTLQLGDTIQPILDCINLAWKTLLFSLTCLLIVRALLPLLPELAQPLLVLTLSFHLGALLFPPMKQHLKPAATFFLVSLLTVLFFIPVTVKVTSHLAEEVTTPMRQNVESYFTELGSVFSVGSITSGTGFSERADALKKKFAQIQSQSGPLAGKAPTILTELLAAKLLNGLVFPLFTAFFLYHLVKILFLNALRQPEAKPSGQTDVPRP